jgi:hypothetical protein
MYKILQAKNNCNILYTRNMVCFGYIIVNTLYKVNNSNDDNDDKNNNNDDDVDLRLSSKTHRNSTTLRTHQLLPTTVFIPNILISNPTPSTQTEQYTYSAESSNSTNPLHQKKILCTTKLKYVAWMTCWCYSVKQKSKEDKEITSSLDFSFFNMLVSQHQQQNNSTWITGKGCKVLPFLS